MAELKTNVMRTLEKEKIPYLAHTYDHRDGVIDGAGVARKMGLDPAKVFKTLVTRGTGRECYVFVIPVERELDLKKCAKAVGEKAVEMIHVSEINKLTGYIRGGCSPVGMKKQFVTVLDSSALEQERIIVSAGKIGRQVELDPRALAGLIGGRFEGIVKD